MGERELSGIKRELKKKLFMEINGIFMAIHVQNTDVVHTDDTEGHGWRSASGRGTGEKCVQHIVIEMMSAEGVCGRA